MMIAMCAGAGTAAVSTRLTAHRAHGPTEGCRKAALRRDSARVRMFIIMMMMSGEVDGGKDVAVRVAERVNGANRRKLVM